jgi:hypothetical protein
MRAVKRSKKSLLEMDSYVQPPLFWPDEQGVLRIPDARAWRRHLPRRRSITNWLFERMPGLVGFGPARSMMFATWLGYEIEAADFQCLTVDEVIKRAIMDLKLERDEAVRMFVKHTSAAAEFQSDGQVVTFR